MDKVVFKNTEMINFLKFITIFFLILPEFRGASQDNLILYTKTGCANCAYAKSTLTANHIKYTEYNADIPENARAMLKVLKERKYEGTIFMPVILYDDQLKFPVTQLKDTFIHVSLHDVVQELSSIQTLKTSYDNLTEPKESNVRADCEFSESRQHTIYYLISGNFDTFTEAQHFITVMNNEGYDSAFVKEWQNIYRVVVAKSDNKDSLLGLYKKVSVHYHGTYILPALDENQRTSAN